MIQRILYKIIKTGIEQVTLDPVIMEELFREQYGLEQTEIDGIQKLWKAKPPTVVHGYAHADSPFPLYAITLQSEREADKFVGDSAGDILDPEDPDFPAECLSAIWQHEYVIWVYAEHPDAVLYYYEIAKHVLLTASDGQAGSSNLFVQNAIMDIDVQGADMAPDPRYIPDHLFVRQIRFSCKREFLRVNRASRLNRAFGITGIFIDSGDDPSDIGSVKTRVTVRPGGFG